MYRKFWSADFSPHLLIHILFLSVGENYSFTLNRGAHLFFHKPVVRYGQKPRIDVNEAD